jgi:hypothetical protein
MSLMNLPPEAEQKAEGEAEAAASGDGCACTMWAVVNADGTLARGFRVTSTARLGSGGQYEVIFDRNVTRCAYVATIGLSGSVGNSPPGETTVVGRIGVPNGVFVTTGNSAGTQTDLGFHLAVHCRP